MQETSIFLSCQWYSTNVKSYSLFLLQFVSVFRLTVDNHIPKMWYSFVERRIVTDGMFDNDFVNEGAEVVDVLVIMSQNK